MTPIEEIGVRAAYPEDTTNQYRHGTDGSLRGIPRAVAFHPTQAGGRSSAGGSVDAPVGLPHARRATGMCRRFPTASSPRHGLLQAHRQEPARAASRPRATPRHVRAREIRRAARAECRRWAAVAARERLCNAFRDVGPLVIRSDRSAHSRVSPAGDVQEAVPHG
jgi:hypothetical protein